MHPRTNPKDGHGFEIRDSFPTHSQTSSTELIYQLILAFSRDMWNDTIDDPYQSISWMWRNISQRTTLFWKTCGSYSFPINLIFGVFNASFVSCELFLNLNPTNICQSRNFSPKISFNSTFWDVCFIWIHMKPIRCHCFEERMERNCEVADLEKCQGTSGGSKWSIACDSAGVIGMPDVVIFCSTESLWYQALS